MGQRWNIAWSNKLNGIGFKYMDFALSHCLLHMNFYILRFDFVVQSEIHRK